MVLIIIGIDFLSLKSDITCDITTRAKIFSRLDRVEQGNLGDSKSIGDNIYELRIHYGPGFRIYFGKPTNTSLLLLAGGTKA
ncbi:MAG: hypothetical protein E4H36_14125 [Spirochaetales bacterium]|nr:MAG: hypothetical protein E4H36_14125 [Spirochaetales bacterium]